MRREFYEVGQQKNTPAKTDAAESDRAHDGTEPVTA
jgi:hypothetical protein